MAIIAIVCVVFCGGIILENFLCFKTPALLFFTGVAMVLSVVFLRSRRLFYIVFYILVFLSGALAYAYVYFLPQNSIAPMRPFLKEDVVIYGVVASDPELRGAQASFILNMVYAQASFGSGPSAVSRREPVSEKVLVEDRQGRHYCFGEELVLKGRLMMPPRILFSGKKFGYAQFLERRGIYFIFKVDKQGVLASQPAKKKSIIKAAAFFVKHKAKAFIARDLKSLHASILYAMLLGERADVPDHVKKTMIKIGVWHVLVVSGLHVALIAAMVLLVLKIFQFSWRARACLTIVFLWFYCFLAGCSVSILRAVMMASIFLVSSLLERKPHFYNTFSLTVLIILIMNPLQLFDIGFQLSFLSVFFIVWFSPKLEAIFSSRFFAKGASGRIRQYFCVALSAWLGTLPIIIFYFNSFSWLAVFANMVIVPLSTLIVTSGLVLIVTEAVCPPVACLIAQASAFFISIFLKIAYFLSALPFGYVKNARVSLVAVLSCYFLIFVLGLLLNSLSRKSLERSNRYKAKR